MRYVTPAIERLFREEKRMALVAGPRQVGKTTLAQSLLEKVEASSNYFNWDNDTHRRAILKNPESFWVTAGGGQWSSGRIRVALDEIHKYPRWKRFLKGLFDVHGRNLELLVTGSGRLDIYQKGGDSLFGRYALYRLHPFTLGELLRADRADVLPPETFWKSVLEQTPHAGDWACRKPLDAPAGTHWLPAFDQQLTRRPQRRFRYGSALAPDVGAALLSF